MAGVPNNRNLILSEPIREPAPKSVAGEPVFAPLCVWCSAEWSPENVQVYAYSGGAGCDTCGYGSEPYGSVKIVCHECGKLMYEKEFEG